MKKFILRVGIMSIFPHSYPLIDQDNLRIGIVSIGHHLEMSELILRKIEELDTGIILVRMDREKDQNDLFLRRNYQDFIITAPAVIEEFVMNLKSVDVCFFERIQDGDSQLPCTNCHPWQFVADRSQHPP